MILTRQGLQMGCPESSRQGPGFHQYLDPFLVPSVADSFRKCIGNKSATFKKKTEKISGVDEGGYWVSVFFFHFEFNQPEMHSSQRRDTKNDGLF